jgi:ferrous iron transport protein A
MIRRHPACTEELIPLGFLARGQSAEIGELVGRPDQVQRLRELGIRPGVQVEMVQPGSPCIVHLDGQRLCFRESEVIGILVRPGVPV